MSIQESVVTFGPDKTLVGILTEPAAEAGRARLGCLLLNTGVNHRIGPRRINVKTAQQLAGSGLPCMRFDMSGIGDSKASGGREGYREQQSADMRAALDQFQESTGISQFVVFGLCTGAVCALHLALADPRIVGVLMFDGYVFLTKATRIERKLHRGLAFPFNAALRSTNATWRDWTGWLRSPFDAGARARFLAHFRKGSVASDSEVPDIFAASASTYKASEFAVDLQKLLDRGVDVYVMYSAMVNATDRNKGMLGQLRGHPCLERIRYKFWPDIDHTMTLIQSQHRLLQAIDQWVAEILVAQHAGAAGIARHRPEIVPRVSAVGTKRAGA